MDTEQQEQQANPASDLAKETEGSSRDAAVVAFTKNRRPVVKCKSPTNAALVKAGLKANLSSAEATAQLRVLCRKFAALTDKVKEETRVREAAEREVRRLKALLEGDTSPVVASCRAETQVYVRELKEAQEKLKRELRAEKEKNERIVKKALELEREKSALISAQTQQQDQSRALTGPLKQDTTSAHQTSWDKEQVQKIQQTLKLTIEELEEELSRKQEEVLASQERSQRDRARVKALEDTLRAKENAERTAQQARRQLEADLRQAQNDITNELENMQRIHDQAQEDRALRETLEQQLVTLGEVNAALEQRSRALVRRLELSSAVSKECQNLKMQLHDAEADNETLVQTIRNLKEEQLVREKEWKVRLGNAKEEKARVEQQVRDLHEDIASLQAQNSLFSEWMLVRSENAIAAQRNTPLPADYQQLKPSKHAVESHTAQSSDSWQRSDNHVGSCSSSDYGDHDASPRVHPTNASTCRPQPSSPGKNVDDDHEEEQDYGTASTSRRVQSRANASSTSRKQTSRKWHSTTSSIPHEESRHSHTDENTRMPPARSPQDDVRRKMSTTSVSSCSSAASVAPSAATSSSSSSAQTDHERLRKLMSRNRELQQRLHQETMATQNLEREITSMTS